MGIDQGRTQSEHDFHFHLVPGRATLGLRSAPRAQEARNHEKESLRSFASHALKSCFGPRETRAIAGTIARSATPKATCSLPAFGDHQQELCQRPGTALVYSWLPDRFTLARGRRRSSGRAEARGRTGHGDDGATDFAVRRSGRRVRICGRGPAGLRGAVGCFSLRLVAASHHWNLPKLA